MSKNFLLTTLGILLIGVMGCEIKTPEIRGVVLDAQTKQPVEGAWVHATVQIKTRTIAGAVQTVLRVEPPHTRSDKNGAFVIPSKIFEKPAFPTGLGTDIENFTINGSTLDDKSDGFYLKDYEGKKKIEVVLHVKPWEKGIKDEKEYFSYIQSLFDYCMKGRLGVEVPPVEGGCDGWELNFAIIKHERYLTKWAEPKDSDQKAKYANTLNQLGYLKEKEGDWQEAIRTYKRLMDFEGKGGWFYKRAENRVRELNEKTKE